MVGIEFVNIKTNRIIFVLCNILFTVILSHNVGICQYRPNNLSINNPIFIKSRIDNIGTLFSISPSIEHSINPRESLTAHVPLVIGNKIMGLGLAGSWKRYKKAPKQILATGVVSDGDSSRFRSHPREFYRNRGRYWGISLGVSYQASRYSDYEFSPSQRSMDDFIIASSIFMGKQWIWNSGVSLNLAGGIGPGLHFYKYDDKAWQLPTYWFGYIKPTINFGMGYSF